MRCKVCKGKIERVNGKWTHTGVGDVHKNATHGAQK